MKKDTAIIKKLVAVAIILIVVTFSIVAFLGVYRNNLNKKSDIINDYTFSSEFLGNREYRLTLDSNEEEKEVYVDENGNICGEAKDKEDASASAELSVDGENNTKDANDKKDENKKTEVEGYSIEKRTIKGNEDSVLTNESYEKTKKIMEKRLKKLGVSEFNIKLNEVTGNIVIELPDNENANFLSEVAYSQGIFEVIDSQTGLKLLDNSNVKKADVGYYNNGNNSITVYLQITLDKSGAEKLKRISNIYVEKPVEETNNTENSTSEENNAEDTETKTETDYIEVKLDGTTILKTYFGEEMDGGILQIPLANDIKADDTEKYTEARKSASSMASILNSGKLPNKYVLENDNFIQSSITDKDKEMIKIVLVGIVALVSIVLVVKFGVKGIIGAILNIGYLAVLSLVLRYTNAVISISSIVTSVFIIVLNFGFIYKFLLEMKKNNDSNKAFAETMGYFYSVMIPVVGVAFVFSFIQNVSIAGIGMVLFWGILIQAIYNLLFTRNVYVLKDK